jgi:putative ABC transport system permease protein
MWRTARKNAFAHKLRLALTALAVVLGVTFMAGTLVLTATVKRSIDGLVEQSVGGYSAVIRASTPYTTSAFGGSAFANDRPTTPDSVLTIAKATPGVAAADGVIEGAVTLVGPNGKKIGGTGGAPSLAFDWVPDHQISQFQLRSGKAPEQSGQMVVDANTAKKHDVTIGETLTVLSNQAPERFRVVGTVGYGKSATIAGATIALFTPADAQRLVGRPGEYTQIDISARPGTSTDALLAALSARIPKKYQAISSQQSAADQASNFNQVVSVFNRVLLAFAFIALFVGAFLIFNTFNILVGQRTKELALYRALGASRGQVTGSVVLEALLTGLIGSLVGVGVGVGLAAVLVSVFRSFLSLATSGLVISVGTIISGLLVGTIITVLSALGPAIRSSRVPPVAAMREDVVIAESSLRRRAIFGGVGTVLGLVVLFASLAGGGGLPAAGLGAALTFVGVAMLLPFVAGPLARIIGAPLTITGITGHLSQENAARNPRRTATTAAALMIGLAVVAAVSTLAASATASFGTVFSQTVKADYVIVPSGSGAGTLPTSVVTAVAKGPGVAESSPVAQTDFHIGQTSHQLIGIDPTTGPSLLDIHMVTGSASALSQGEVLVDTTAAKSHHYKVGSTIPMGFASTSGVRTYTIGGTYKVNGLLGSYLAPISVITANTNQPSYFAIMVRVSSVSKAEQTALAKSLTAFPQASVKTAAQYIDQQKNQIGMAVRIVDVLLGFSIVIALIGVINTLVLSVLERTHEIGLLRAVGMLRSQIRRVIRGEAIVVSVLGAVVGLVLGVGFGVALVKAVSSSGIGQVAIPVSTIIVVLVLAILFGIFASIFPARRASKLDVLKAISTA